MKSSFFALGASVCLLVGCASLQPGQQADAPLWVNAETLSSAFAPQDYVAQIGFADTAETAQVQADAALSAYFSQSVSVQTGAQESLYNAQGNTIQSRSLVRTIAIDSHAELVALRHTQAYFDQARKKYAVCAYINRTDAWQLLEPKLQSHAQAFATAYTASQTERELFTKILLVNRANGFADEFYTVYALACCIVPQKAVAFAATDALMQKTRTESMVLKQQASVAVVACGDDTGRIQAKLSDLLAKNGFLVSAGKSLYTARVAVDATASENGGVFIAYPHSTVVIENGDGTTVASYAKQLQKVAAYTKAAAERMALHNLETELERSFASECLYEKGVD